METGAAMISCESTVTIGSTTWNPWDIALEDIVGLEFAEEAFKLFDLSSFEVEDGIKVDKSTSGITLKGY